MADGDGGIAGGVIVLFELTGCRSAKQLLLQQHVVEWQRRLLHRIILLRRSEAAKLQVVLIILIVLIDLFIRQIHPIQLIQNDLARH